VNLGFGFGSVFAENRGFGFGFKTDPALLLAAEIGLPVWGTPPNFNGLRLLQRYCTAVKQWLSAKLCGVEQRAPPMFGRATITLGIGPHF